MTLNSTTMEKPSLQKESIKPEYKIRIVWFNLIFFIYLHLIFLYAIYLGVTSSSLKTVLFAYIYAFLGGIGVSVGLHRLWSHRSFKAKLPLRVLLCVFSSIASQNDIYEWCRDHRVHHKFTETDADPHNIKRGFFFAHIGWLMCRKHPDVLEKGKTVCLEDLMVDPIVRFHREFYFPMSLFFCFILPTMIPTWCWNETWWNSFFIAGVGKYCLSLNFTWLLNSAAHKYGYRPYNNSIEARNNGLVAFCVLGDGWHNFHHVFPWDYSSSEFGYMLNFGKIFIDFMALIGQAYDLKTASPKVIKKFKLNTRERTKMI